MEEKDILKLIEEEVPKQMDKGTLENPPFSTLTKEMVKQKLAKLFAKDSKRREQMMILEGRLKKLEANNKKSLELMQHCLASVDVLSEILMQRGAMTKEDIDNMVFYGTINPTEEQIKEREEKLKELENKVAADQKAANEKQENKDEPTEKSEEGKRFEIE